MNKVIVIGLDGATWDLIKPWADKGDLPAFRKLIREGVHGMLRSVIPPVTAPAWASFATGKNPGKHGIFDFVRMERNKVRMVSGGDLRCDTFYDILSREGFRNIIVGLPLSFPPSDSFKGVMISDFLYPRKEIVPNEKSQYIGNYQVRPNYRSCKSREDMLDEIRRTAVNRIETTKKLIMTEIWDFFFLHYGETDWISHRFWVDIKNNTEMGQKAKSIFIVVDKFIDWLLGWMDEKYRLFIVSDHGFEDCRVKINLNQVFVRKGLLKICYESTSELDIYTNLYRSTNERGRVSRRPILRFIRDHLAMNRLNPRNSKLRSNSKAKSKFKMTIDYENSKVFTPVDESGHIYLNEPKESNKEEIMKDIIETLEHVEYEGSRVFRRVLRREEVYSGPYANEAPDITLDPNGFFVSKTLYGPLFERYAREGQHGPEGIFLAYGPDIRRAIETSNIGICDIAPTILHIFGLPIPNDMDGQVLMQIFEECSEVRKRMPTFAEPTHHGRKLTRTNPLWHKEKKIRNRLKELGYL